MQYRIGQQVSFRWAGTWCYGKVVGIQTSPEYGLQVELQTWIGHLQRVAFIMIFPASTPVQAC